MWATPTRSAPLFPSHHPYFLFYFPWIGSFFRDRKHVPSSINHLFLFYWLYSICFYNLSRSFLGVIKKDMASPAKNLDQLSLKGGALGLDFVNTLDWRGRAQRIDYLSDYGGLLAWWVWMGLVKPREKDALARKAAGSPQEAEQAAARAVELREALYRVFTALSMGRQPGPGDLEVLAPRLAWSLAGIRLSFGDNALAKEYEDQDDSLDWPLKPVVRSALEVLTSVDPDRIKVCGDPECGWLFWDQSKNKSRRWCSMSDCGNRAKAGRFYRKSKTGSP